MRYEYWVSVKVLVIWGFPCFSFIVFYVFSLRIPPRARTPLSSVESKRLKQSVKIRQMSGVPNYISKQPRDGKRKLQILRLCASKRGVPRRLTQKIISAFRVVFSCTSDLFVYGVRTSVPVICSCTSFDTRVTATREFNILISSMTALMRPMFAKFYEINVYLSFWENFCILTFKA